MGEDKFPENNLAHDQLTTLHVAARMRASFLNGYLCITTRPSCQIYSCSNWLLVLYRDINNRFHLQFQYLYSWNTVLFPPPAPYTHLDLQEEKKHMSSFNLMVPSHANLCMCYRKMTQNSEPPTLLG